MLHKMGHEHDQYGNVLITRGEVKQTLTVDVGLGPKTKTVTHWGYHITNLSTGVRRTALTRSDAERHAAAMEGHDVSPH